MDISRQEYANAVAKELVGLTGAAEVLPFTKDYFETYFETFGDDSVLYIFVPEGSRCGLGAFRHDPNAAISDVARAIAKRITDVPGTLRAIDGR